MLCTDTRPTEHYTLSLHDALPISMPVARQIADDLPMICTTGGVTYDGTGRVLRRLTLPLDLARFMLQEMRARSEEHTSELQSRENLVCRLLLEKKNTDAPLAPTRV